MVISLKHDLSSDTPDPKSVMVIHGRNDKVKDSLFSFLRSLCIEPLEWDAHIDRTKDGSPYIGEVIIKAFSIAKTFIVLMTPDDLACLREDLWNEKDALEDKNFKGQPRQNVLFEAGMAFALYPESTIFVCIGDVRILSDIHGKSIIHLSNELETRKALAQRLKSTGCSVQTSGNDWINAGDFSIEKINVEITGHNDVYSAYIVALDFMKIIHHHFQDLQLNGFQKLIYASRTLYMSQSQGNDPKLANECFSGWSETNESRTFIQKEVLNRRKRLYNDVDKAYTLLWTSKECVAPIIAPSFSSFQAIKESINKYNKVVPKLEILLDSKNKDVLISDQITDFNQNILDFSVAVERLIRESDSGIRNLINAMQKDDRV
jgi:predicted nucleotide-binding protein